MGHGDGQTDGHGGGHGGEAAARARTAVVTGGSRGIGRAVVERLCRDGIRVVFNYATSDDAAREVVKAVTDAGGEAHALRLDLTGDGAAQQLMEAADRTLGGLDILVNNAALAVRPAPLADTDPADFDRTMRANATTVFTTLRYAARHLRDGGRIVNISTLNTVRPAPGAAAYIASKGAIEQLTAVAALELGPRGITVNTVSPGATDTRLLRDANPAEALEDTARATPLGRLGDPADVADVIAFLIGPDGRWMTGQNLRATGGLA